jgi:hypothetical protein
MAQVEPGKQHTNGHAVIVPIKGKIQEIYEFKKKAGGYLYETIVVMPSPDEFESPLKLTIKSNDKTIGKVGEMTDIKTRMASRYWKSDKDGKVNYSPELWLAE